MIISTHEIVNLGPPIPICTVQSTNRTPRGAICARYLRYTTQPGYRVSKHFVVSRTTRRNWGLFNGHGFAGPEFPNVSIAIDMAHDLEALDIDWTLPTCRNRPPKLQAVLDKYHHCRA